MTQRFSNAIEATKVFDALREQVYSLPYNRDLRKLLSNIRIMIDDFSKEEVDAKRNKTLHHIYTGTAYKKLTESIENIEQLILLATLLQ